ncbi:hypothetical protein [Ferrovibrio sp.]|uniref:hypothetical protein n=1 Tax=Ferrovibrio sp. TaxID=1917215 RepID=UPI000CCAE7F0|nr:hypothetical protein [Ferrovibrio sp.]PJI39238.1 MAG: hypothetical protein CTR53_15200 [Ferrovibrio sp.]
MARTVLPHGSDGHVLLLDSIAEILPEDAGWLVISGSHGGISAAQFAVAVQLRGCFLNDAGLGKDNAGIAGLALLAYPAAAYSHSSARIGDAADAWANGILTHINAAGRAAGWRDGQSVQDAAAMLRQLRPV